MRDRAIRLTHPMVVTINNEQDAYDQHGNPVTLDEVVITAEIARLQADYAAKQYQRDRAKAYPPATDYLDGIVKGDQAQINAYIAACLAVKAKYPKG